MDWTQTFTIIGSMMGAVYAFYHMTEKRIDKLEEGMTRMDNIHREDIQRMDENIQRMDAKWDTALQRMDAKWDTALQKMDEKLEKMDAKWERLFERLLIQDQQRREK